MAGTSPELEEVRALLAEQPEWRLRDLRRQLPWAREHRKSLDNIVGYLSRMGEVRRTGYGRIVAQPGARPASLTLRGLRRWRHVRTGGTYQELGRARMQADVPDGLSVSDMAPVVVYRAERGGHIWVRPVAEFEDGRFEEAT